MFLRIPHFQKPPNTSQVTNGHHTAQLCASKSCVLGRLPAIAALSCASLEISSGMRREA